MKEGWKMVKLGKIVTTSNGLWKGKKPPYINIAVIRNTNFTKDCKLRLDEIEYIDAEEKHFLTRKLEYGDIIIEKSGGSDKQPVGRPVLFNIKDGNFSYSNFTSRIRIIDNKIIDSSFLQKALYNHYIKGSTFPLQSNTTGIHNLDFKGYLELEIPLPPLEEQHRIVSILDASFEKIDALKKNAEENLKNAKALFQQVLAQELEPKEGWVEKKLGDIFKFIDYRGSTPTKISSGIPLITAKNVRMGYLDYTIKDFISQKEYFARQSRGISRKGDLLFTTEAPLGNVALADLEEYSAGQRVITFQQYPDGININNKFYLWYLMSPNFQKNVRDLATGLTAQGIKAKILKDIVVYYPSIDEQNNIANNLDTLSEKCRRLEEVAQQTIRECDALKQSILRQAFSGEL